MKIQKQLSKKLGEKIYHKYVVVIPEKIVKDSELKEGDELEAEVSKHRISLKKRLE